MLDRRFNHDENAAIVKKAIKYKNRGVVGVDLAGPVKRNGHSQSFKPADIMDLIKLAKDNGLG